MRLVVRKLNRIPRSLTRDNFGFTIIEVLVVLAIAGLILLVVFLAIPSLQRSQRNQGRSRDATRIVAAFNDFLSTSNGVLPGNENGPYDWQDWYTDCQTIAADAGALSQFGDSSGNLSSWCQDSATQENHAAAQNWFVDDFTYAGDISSSSSTAAWLVFTQGVTCPASQGTDVTPQAGNSKQSILLYPLETGSGNEQIACIQIT